MSRPSITYNGTRSFPADLAGLKSELERLAQEVDRLTRLTVAQKSSVLEFLDLVAFSTTTPTALVGIEQARPVVGTGSVSLPRIKAEMYGKQLAVQRASAAGTVTVRPAPAGPGVAAQTINGATSATLAAAVGLYFFTATPSGWN